MATSPDLPFSVDADLLYERTPERCDEKITAIDVLDEFLSNVGRLAKFVEPCKIKLIPKVSIEITSTVSEGPKSNTLQWNDIQQVHALAPSHPRYNNVVSILSTHKIFLVHLKSIQAGRFAAYLQVTQLPSMSLYDSQKETETAMLEKCFDELETFVNEETKFVKKKMKELDKFDDEILQLTGKKKVKRCRRILSRFCSCCFGCCCCCALPTLDRCLQARNATVLSIEAKRQRTIDALQTIRHAFLIFTRVAPTLQRIGYCNSHVEFGRKLIEQFSSVTICAKTIAKMRSEPGADLSSGDEQFSIIASVNTPPLTDIAIKTIETYLPENPELAADWPKFGRNWSLCIHEEDIDLTDWSMANHQHLKELNRDVEMLTSTLRKSYQQLIERQLISEVEQTKRNLQERLKEIEQQKKALSDNNCSSCDGENFLQLGSKLPPARMTGLLQRAFMVEVKKRNGRAVLVTQSNGVNVGPGEYIKVCDKEILELLEELHSGTCYRVRNADGVIGTLPAGSVVELKL